jgi:hypothetical protein
LENEKIKIGDLVTPKFNAVSMFHGQVGFVIDFFKEDIAIVDFGLDKDGEMMPVVTLTECLVKVFKGRT